MSYVLTVGSLHFLPGEALRVQEECSCEEARQGCLPSFVFSLEGQIRFRTALRHLAVCEKSQCRKLRRYVLGGMRDKLSWLMDEECLLGCVLVQPSLYGAKRVILQNKDFVSVAHHLAKCPKESCAQLRRALLLTVRDEVRVTTIE